MLAFLLVVGVSYYAVATSLISLVGDYLFADRRARDQASAEKLAVEVAEPWINARMDTLQTLLENASGELGGRVMLLDTSGKVQADSYSELNGTRMELPEVAAILVDGKTVDYGVHQLGSAKELDLLSFLTPFDQSAVWVGYCTAAITFQQKTVGILLFSSPIQDMMTRLTSLQSRMDTRPGSPDATSAAVTAQNQMPQEASGPIGSAQTTP